MKKAAVAAGIIMVGTVLVLAIRHKQTCECEEIHTHEKSPKVEEQA